MTDDAIEDRAAARERLRAKPGSRDRRPFRFQLTDAMEIVTLGELWQARFLFCLRSRAIQLGDVVVIARRLVELQSFRQGTLRLVGREEICLRDCCRCENLRAAFCVTDRR